MLARAVSRAEPSLALIAASRRHIWLASKAFPNHETRVHVAKVVMYHPDPPGLRKLLVEGLGLQHMVSGTDTAATANSVEQVGHAPWPSWVLESSVKAPPSDTLVMDICGPQSLGNEPTTRIRMPQAGIPVLTIGVPDVALACDRAESLGLAVLTSPPSSAADPSPDLAEPALPDSGLIGALLEDDHGTCIEVLNGFTAPRIASAWCTCADSGTLKDELAEACGLVPLRVVATPGHPSAHHLAYTAHPAEFTLALTSPAAADAGAGDDLDTAAETEASAGSWLSFFSASIGPKDAATDSVHEAVQDEAEEQGHELLRAAGVLKTRHDAEVTDDTLEIEGGLARVVLAAEDDRYVQLCAGVNRSGQPRWGDSEPQPQGLPVKQLRTVSAGAPAVLLTVRDGGPMPAAGRLPWMLQE